MGTIPTIVLLVRAKSQCPALQPGQSKTNCRVVYIRGDDGRVRAGQICMLQQHTLRDFAWLCIQLGLSVACRVTPSLVGHGALDTALEQDIWHSNGFHRGGALTIGLLMLCSFV